MQYKVISRAIKDDFEEDVNQALAEGWELHGSLVPGDVWKQVMIKHEKRTGFTTLDEYYTVRSEKYGE